MCDRPGVNRQGHHREIPRHLLDAMDPGAKKPDPIGLFGNNNTQNPRPKPQEKSET
jgi:hypothetical protein